jgi:hypothetical protein
MDPKNVTRSFAPTEQYLPPGSHPDVIASYRAQMTSYAAALRTKNMTVYHIIFHATAAQSGIAYYLESKALAPLEPVETGPGNNMTSDADLEGFIGNNLTPTVSPCQNLRDDAARTGRCS